MKFGLFFSFQFPRPWPPGGELRLFQEGLDQVELGDRIGIQYCWGQEHDFLEEYSHSSAPEVYLGAFSQRTRRMRLGHGIVHMPRQFNHPVRVAERIATLDLISGGRAEWGTGEGGTRIELEAFQVPYVDKRAMWEEAVRECARMMSMEPYPGYRGRSFEVPARNVVPKPIQQPHPPIWYACTNREALRFAARHGIGALTFAFMDAREARFWVREYYETFKRECRPIGRCVNPNVAMLSQFMCHKDHHTALEKGVPGAQFFAYGLSHYYRTGSHLPGKTRLWEQFLGRHQGVMAGNLGIGSPAEITKHFKSFEDAGVDQIILLHQAGKYHQEDVLGSLDLFGAEVLPQFIERDENLERQKQQVLAPFVAKAMERVTNDQQIVDIPLVESYPVLAQKKGIVPSALQQDRAPLKASMWRFQVGGPVRRKDADGNG